MFKNPDGKTALNFHRASGALDPPMNPLQEQFADLAPWIFQFRIGGHDYGGGISAVGDVRLDRFFRYAPHAKTILELGSLEGAHTFLLAQRPGVNALSPSKAAKRICAKRDSSRNSGSPKRGVRRRPTWSRRI